MDTIVLAERIIASEAGQVYRRNDKLRLANVKTVRDLVK